jgi:hypothetical protein
MAGFVAKWVAKRFLGETLENKFGTEVNNSGSEGCEYR